MGNLLRSALFLAPLLLAQGCLFGETSTSGPLDCGNGEEFTLYAKWKKIQGYEEIRTEAELKNDFHVLIIEPGGSMCESEVVDSGLRAGAIRYQAAYGNDETAEELSIVYDPNSIYPDVSVRAQYKLTGTCEDPRLRLTYSDSSPQEIYKIYSRSVEINDCLRY